MLVGRLLVGFVLASYCLFLVSLVVACGAEGILTPCLCPLGDLYLRGGLERAGPAYHQQGRGIRLVYGGYTYCKDNAYGNTVYWRCAKKKVCKARLKVVGSDCFISRHHVCQFYENLGRVPVITPGFSGGGGHDLPLPEVRPERDPLLPYPNLNSVL